MNRQTDLQSWLELAQNCVSRALRPCIGWMPCLQRRRQVHPTTSSSFAGNQFVQLSSQRRIRVVHVDLNRHKSNSWYINSSNTQMEIVGYHLGFKHRSLSLTSNFSELSSEEYWFTRWNQPIRISDTCNCSFRKSWRNSLVDSREMINQTDEKTKDGVDQSSDNPPLYERCVDQNMVPSEKYNFLHIEPFVEILLQEVWNEVFSCLSEINSRTRNSHHLELEEEHFNATMQNRDDLDVNYVCRRKSDPISNCRLKTEDFNCKTLISCHQTEDECHITETVSNNVEEHLVSEPFRSVGCVNPSFLGSVTNPDILEYVVTCDIQASACDDSTLRCDVEGAKCFDDSDSGFNTVSLESTNNHANEIDCPVVSKVDSESLCVRENTQTESYTASSNDILLTMSEPHVSTKSDFNVKTNEAKDDAQEYNQTNFTSVDLRLKDTCKMQDSIIPDTGKQSQKLNIHLRKNKQCYHTRNIRRLKPLLYFLHGVGCSADLWSALLEHFTAAGFEVVAPDMLGHGYSSAPDNASAYTFHRLLKDTIDIFDRFVGENRKCVVIGHAYGCSLAAAVARYRAQQVSHLVLISGGGPAPLAPRTADSRPPSVSPCLLACMKPLLMCGFRRNILYAPCGKHIESCPSMSKGVPRYVLHHVAQGQDWPEGDATFHRRILVPTLLVHGLQDPYVTLVQECEMERTIPRSFLELIPDAGHLSMLETPSQLSHMIHCFIDWWSR